MSATSGVGVGQAGRTLSAARLTNIAGRGRERPRRTPRVPVDPTVARLRADAETYFFIHPAQPW